MDFSKLAEHILTRRFEFGGDGFDVVWDANKFTGDLDRRIASLYRERATNFEERKESKKKTESLVESADRLARELDQSAAISDLQKEVWADCLAVDGYGIMKDWEIERDGVHLMPVKDELMKLPASLLSSIFKFCRDESLPKSQATEQTTASQTIPETTDDTSSGDQASVANPIM